MKPMGGRTWKYWPASGPVFFHELPERALGSERAYTQYYINSNGSVVQLEAIERFARLTEGSTREQFRDKTNVTH